MTTHKLIEKIRQLSDDCQKDHPATAVHLAVVSNALVHPAIMQAVSSALLPVAQTLSAAHESVKITQVVIEDQKPKDKNEQN